MIQTAEGYKLSELLKTAEELGENLWKRREKIRISEIMLYGSVASEVQNPNDIDMLVFHSNPIFDEFQNIYRNNSEVSDKQKLSILLQMLNSRGMSVEDVVSKPEIKELVSNGKLDILFMNEDFFVSREYRTQWRKTNSWDLGFERRIIRDHGILWNPRTKKYDTPANTRYKVPED